MIKFEFKIALHQLHLEILINNINVTEHYNKDQDAVNKYLSIDLTDIPDLIEWARDIVEPATTDPIFPKILTNPNDINSPIINIMQVIKDAATPRSIPRLNYPELVNWAEIHSLNLIDYCVPPLVFYKQDDNVRIRTASLFGNLCKHVKYTEVDEVVPIQNFKEELFKFKKRLVYLIYFNAEEIADFGY